MPGLTIPVHRAQELCESRGGRPGHPIPNKPYGFYGRKPKFDEEYRSFFPQSSRYSHCASPHCAPIDLHCITLLQNRSAVRKSPFSHIMYSQPSDSPSVRESCAWPLGPCGLLSVSSASGFGSRRVRSTLYHFCLRRWLVFFIHKQSPELPLTTAELLS